MESQKNSSVGLSGLVMTMMQWIFIVFLVLKLVGQIDWSWWWITSPLWIPVIGAILIGIIIVILREIVD